MSVQYAILSLLMLMNKKGSLIAFEGIDGSGKGTQAKLLLDYLSRKKITYASFDFPQYRKTFFGDFAGRFLNGEFGHFSRINPYLASFPYAADRWQVKDQLWKAIAKKQLVVCNRYTPSSVYQAVKVKLDERKKFFNWIETLEYQVFGIPKPDLVIFLNVPLPFAQTLISKKMKDQYERNTKYLEKVEKMYLKILQTNKNWVKIDCVENKIILPIAKIHEKIITILEKKGYVSTSAQV